MLQDLAAIAPPLIICVAFLVGVGYLFRHELAPRRRGAGRVGDPAAPAARVVTKSAETIREPGDSSQT
jgi:hypothetical protein